MPKIKPHIAPLHRTPPMGVDRKHFLRLDMNEDVDGLSEDFVREVLSEISPEFLATYPEYEGLIQKIAEPMANPTIAGCIKARPARVENRGAPGRSISQSAKATGNGASL